MPKFYEQLAIYKFLQRNEMSNAVSNNSGSLQPPVYILLTLVHLLVFTAVLVPLQEVAADLSILREDCLKGFRSGKVV